MNDDEKVLISRKRFGQLLEDSRMLARLYEAGVDNWEGYSEACEDEEDEEDED